MRRIRRLALAALCFLVAFGVPGHGGVATGSSAGLIAFQHWANLYDLNNGHGASYNGYSMGRVRQTSDGGFAVGLTKWHDSASDGGEEMCAVKLDPAGNVMWAVSPLATAGDDGECHVRGTAVLSDGRIATLATFYDGYDSPSAYIVLMVLGPDGAFQWMKTFLGTFDPPGYYDLQPLKSGGLLVAAPLAQGHWVAKLNSSGRIVWQARLDATICSVQQTSDGGFIAAGASGGELGHASSDAWIAKFSALGNISWQRACGDPALADSFHRVVVMGDGYVAAGETYGLGASVKDIWVIKFDFQGHVRWQYAYGRQGTGFQNWLTALARLHEGGIILGGNTGSDVAGAPPGYGFVLKLASTGAPVWQKNYQVNVEDAIQTRWGDYILIGLQNLGPCYPIGNSNTSYMVITRVDTLGGIGTGCCLVGAADIIGRRTAAVPYNTHYSTYHSPATVRSLLATDPGFMPVDVTGICQADLK